MDRDNCTTNSLFRQMLVRKIDTFPSPAAVIYFNGLDFKQEISMVNIQLVDTDHRSHGKQFVEYPFKLYKDCPQWVPPLFTDSYLQLNRRKHPFFEHSDADFF